MGLPAGGAVTVASRLPGRAGAGLLDAARISFSHGLNEAALGAAAVMVLAAVLSAVFFRGVRPAEPQPRERQPAGTEPVVARPAGALPAGAQPVVAQPAGALPAGAQPGDAQPAPRLTG